MRAVLHRPLLLAAVAAALAVACSSVASVVTPQPSPTARQFPLTPTETPVRPTATPLPVLDEKYTRKFEELRPEGVQVLDPDVYKDEDLVDVILPIYDPAVVGPAESKLFDEERILGVEINGQARAYPIRIMAFREMVNDVVGEVPVLVSW